ncbi:mannose-1-phosphate guanylyltransferase [Treponema endosymbiont of Eucomonympha sp.]|uniref:mannose-1-phosphate guanylyltransferase n=1 Tax=Treponema endosymbiont of Eucomonympha sp. TaxID=1580831 RepID=UPI0007842EE5|nr:mannose-1-phosphate guanylyltransferase [Treponema endosymbiont of Eucomonympha sp.]
MKKYNTDGVVSRPAVRSDAGFTDIVILAGGVGERLWSASTKAHPKQFIKAFGEHSFFQMAVSRALALKPSGVIMVITRREFVDIAAAECASFASSLPEAERLFLESALVIFGEPEPRHTAAAVECACMFSRSIYDSVDGRTMLVLTSDHIIKPETMFVASCGAALNSVRGDRFVCFGITPDFPATGFGYIKTDGYASESDSALAVRSFHEKPDEKTARTYIAEGNCWWNSGMFAFMESHYLAEINRFVPELSAAFEPLAASKPELSLKQNIRVIQKWSGLEWAYLASPSISIDNAVAEKTAYASCVPAAFSWSDVGNWDAFVQSIPCPMHNIVNVESDDCSVYSDIPVALCGVSGLIVVIQDGQALILKKGKSDLVRDAVRQIALCNNG